MKYLLPFVYGFAGTFIVALGLILIDRKPETPTSGGLNFTERLQRGLSALPAPRGVDMRDGYALQVRALGASDADTMFVLVHGSGWNGLQFDGLGPALAQSGRVLIPDLRGHGAEPGRRGDVDYIGQLEDDLADLIRAEATPSQKVIVVGHSSGGGLVVRMAGGQHRDLMDGAVLLAPFLKHNAPTTRPNSGGWAQVRTKRIIGLSILNTFRIRVLNHLPIIHFAMPDSVMSGPIGHLATTEYSYRLNTSFAPRSNYTADIAALPPFALVVGAEDEAFFAAEYEPLMSVHSDVGRYVIVDGENHLGVVDAARTLDEIRDFAESIR